jgi:nickel-dependent lactate racemase
MHGPAIMEHPNASNGVLAGNPFHEEALEIARLAGVDFIVNVVIDQERTIGKVFAGDLEKAHEEGVAFCRDHVVDWVDGPVDIVVTSNAGYPLDSNYYQTVKGMVTALDILKTGGTIVMASACSDGVGSNEFREMLEETDDLEAFIRQLQEPGYFRTDQWEMEELYKALKSAEVLLYTKGLSKHDVQNCLVKPIGSVEEGVAMALGKHGLGASIAVIPQGPYVMGRIAENKGR